MIKALVDACVNTCALEPEQTGVRAHSPAPADGVLCGGAQSVETAKSYLADAPNVTVVPMEINDGWARDWGPSVRLPHIRPCCVGVSAGGSGRPWAEHSGGLTNAFTYHVGAHTAVLGMLGTHREHMHDHEVCRHVYNV